jgi:hypothetical protein
LELIGAFLSGVGAVLGAGIALRRTIKRCERECDLRMEAFREGLHEGKERKT